MIQIMRQWESHNEEIQSYNEKIEEHNKMKCGKL